MTLASCSTTTGKTFDPAAARSVQPGTTTKEQLVVLLGKPVSRASDSGHETWTYQHSTIGGGLGASAFIPFVGGMMPGAYQADEKEESVLITLDDNVVSSCKLTQRTAQRRSGGGILGPLALMQPTESTETQNCHD